MQWFINFSTRVKLSLALGAMWLLMAALTVTAYMSLTGIIESEKDIHDSDFTAAQNIKQLRSNNNYNHSQMLELILASDRQEQKKIQAAVAERVQNNKDLLKKSLKVVQDQELRDGLLAYEKMLTTHQATREEIFSLVFQGRAEEAKKMELGIQSIRFDEMRGMLVDLGTRMDQLLDKQLVADMESGRIAVIWFIGLGLAALILGIVMIFLLDKAISKPVSEVSATAGLIAAGDLTVDIAADERKDEIGDLKRAFRTLAVNLRRNTSQIAEAVAQLGSSASEILAGTTQVATGTAENAAAIGETTTTVEEVRQASQMSLQKAKAVSDSAQRIAQVSQSGRKAVEEAAAGMTQIRAQMEAISGTIVRLSEQGQSIGGITAAVSDLADQSNLLAVNAAIEAARAGEHGKGFAVVAQEIKSLAEQSKQATAQVRAILNDVQKSTSAAVMATDQGSRAVEAGARQAAQAGDAIEKLAESSSEAVQAAVQIVASSQQQQQGMEQIGKAMESINQAGAQTAASMKQAENSARDMQEMGLKLKRLVEQYKI